ncbi:hypothetical protein BO78DRAFT_385726 [Aspergillus sclerotiicarbonarius CBS 121057]|uniref:CCHC-type domain-containing protein n=1 Tax=Aspergillus sclerotiicarbonarius (strain CBS 121057 / IBT 28362) TaxID=1448318 RepID=A0A319EM58_ASPSB|nr:hypothetical protein BO78DRAFT_385726 [Aspergillus sclerotiicarbonarius CBS 121057]
MSDLAYGGQAFAGAASGGRRGGGRRGGGRKPPNARQDSGAGKARVCQFCRGEGHVLQNCPVRREVQQEAARALEEGGPILEHIDPRMLRDLIDNPHRPVPAGRQAEQSRQRRPLRAAIRRLRHEAQRRREREQQEQAGPGLNQVITEDDSSDDDSLGGVPIDQCE